jgi:hypothetical protein
MKILAFLAAALFTCALAASSYGATPRGDRMVGGGYIQDPNTLDGFAKIREGMVIYCIGNPDLRPSVEVTWGKGNSFHLTSIGSVACSQNVPGLDDGGSITGFGEGRCNGQHAFISFEFTDNTVNDPDIRTPDFGELAIEGDDPDVCSISTSGFLLGGNFTFIDNPDI